MLQQTIIQARVAFLSLFNNKKNAHGDQEQTSQRRFRSYIYVIIILILFFLIYFSFVGTTSPHSSHHNQLEPKPSSEEAFRNLQSDLNEVALEVQHGGVPHEQLYNQEDFFVVWNRVFMLAADVAPTVITGEYRNFPEHKSEDEFYNHFRFLLRSGNPKHYKPLHPNFQFVPIANRFEVGEKDHQQEDGANNFFDPAKPFVVFIRTNEISNFYNQLTAIIKSAASETKNHDVIRKFILVTGWTDPGPSDYGNAQELLANPYLVRWWAQNCDVVASPKKSDSSSSPFDQPPSSSDNNNNNNNNNKMHCLPIGIDWHTIARGPRWGLPQMTPFKQVEKMRELANDEANFFLNFKQAAKERQHGIATHKFTDRRNKILMDFALGSNTQSRLKMWLGLAFGSPLCMSPHTATGNWFPTTRNNIWRNYLYYRFVLSPPGNGYECHRTYEALILGAIPIMKYHPNPAVRPMIAKLYEDLPVIFVEDYTCEYINSETIAQWNKVGEEFWGSQRKVDRMRKKLLNKYWLEKIRSEY